MQDLSHQGQDEIDSSFLSLTTSSTRLSGQWQVPVSMQFQEQSRMPTDQRTGGSKPRILNSIKTYQFNLATQDTCKESQGKRNPDVTN